MVKLVFISDTHVQHEGLNLPAGDILVHAGDFTGRGTVDQIAKFNYWLGKQPFKHRLVIAGNHDWLFQTDPALAQGLLTNATYLQDSGVELEGIKFWGSPWQPEFNHWAFNLDTQAELAAKWALIPEDTNVVITHGPPWGMGDVLVPSRIRVGCQALLQRLLEIKPDIHVCGHIHEGYGVRNALGITFVNASILDENYRRANEPIVLELEPPR